MHRIIREYSVLSKMWAVFLQKYVLGFLTLLCRVQLGSSYSQSCKSALVMLHIKVLERTTHNPLIMIIACWRCLSTAHAAAGAGRIWASSSCQVANASGSLERLKHRRLKCKYTRSSARSGSNLCRFPLHTKSYVDQLRSHPPALATIANTCMYH